MAASKSEEELMVVTVDEDGDLRFHPEVLQSLLSNIKQQSKNKEIPVVIIGVIGEPNTNKACFVNLIRYYIDSINSNNQSSQDLDWILQVWNDVNKKKRVEYGNVKYGLSIGSSKPRLIKANDGSQVAVLVLDIWCSNDELSNGIKTAVYNKLIDLCLCLSSAIVYTSFGTASASPKAIKDYLWIPSESEVFKNLNSESFQNLFIVLQEWSFKHLIWFGKDGRGQKSFLESTSQPFKCLSKIKNLAIELKSKFQNSVCYLLPSEKQDQMILLRNINQLVQNILYSADYKLTPVIRQRHTITVKSLENFFFNGVSISNNPSILTEHFPEENSRQNSNNNQQKQQLSKKSTSEISIIVEEPAALAKSTVKEQLNFKSFLDNYEKEIKDKFHSGLSVDKLYFEEDELKKLHSDTLEKTESAARQNFNTFLVNLNSSANEYYNKICTENSERQKKYEKLKNDSTKWSQNRLKAVQDWMKNNSTDKSPKKIRHEVESYFIRESNKIIQNLEPPWNIYFSSLINSHKNEIINALNSMLFGIKSYEEKMINILRTNIYLTENDFESAHNRSFQESIVENPGSGEELFKDSMDKAILHIKCKLVKQNSVVVGHEEKISTDALKLVIEEYHKIMKSDVTPNRILTDNEIEQLHKKTANILIRSFLDNPDFNFTPVWKILHNGLDKILNDGILLNQYLQENEQRIENLQLKRQKIMEEAERTYKESMNCFLQTAEVTESRMSFFHETSMKKGLDLYVDKMGRDGSINWDLWGNILRNKMNNLAQSLLVENGIKLPVSESSCSQDEKMEEEVQNQNFGGGICIGPNVVLSSVVKEADRLSSSPNNTTVQPRVSSPSAQKKNQNKTSEDESTQNTSSKFVELLKKLETMKNDDESLTAIQDVLEKLEKK